LAVRLNLPAASPQPGGRDPDHLCALAPPYPADVCELLPDISHPSLLTYLRFYPRAFQNLTLYGALYFIFVFFFTYFYTAVTFDPHQISENLQKNGAFIPGVRPGVSTSEYLGKDNYAHHFVGALFLALIAVLPIIMQSITGITTSLALGGTALLIVVSVILDLARRIDAQISIREY
jgi:preprotein translocase subunit SecY